MNKVQIEHDTSAVPYKTCDPLSRSKDRVLSNTNAKTHESNYESKQKVTFHAQKQP
jgi:hypothetical protein